MNLPEHPSPSEPGTPAGPVPLRASDADRDRVADRLREALAEGRITPEEHAERIDAVYRAKTYADLEPVLGDLPGAEDAVPAAHGGPKVRLRKDEPELPPPAAQSTTVMAIFGGAERKGRWLVEPNTTVTCMFGGVSMDFRQAVLTQREVTLNITCVFGGVDVTVPPGVRVVNSSTAIFGGHDLPGDDPEEPDAPVIRLTGMVLFGGVAVKRSEPDAPRPGRRGASKQEIRESQREQMNEIRESLRESRRDHLEQLRESRRDHHRHRHGRRH